jgi:hypothetical protein
LFANTRIVLGLKLLFARGSFRRHIGEQFNCSPYVIWQHWRNEHFPEHVKSQLAIQALKPGETIIFDVSLRAVIARRRGPNPLRVASDPGSSERGFKLRRHSAQVLVEPIQRVLPSLLCSGFVVSRCRVVVETVVGALIDVTLVRHVGFG